MKLAKIRAYLSAAALACSASLLGAPAPAEAYYYGHHGYYGGYRHAEAVHRRNYVAKKRYNAWHRQYYYNKKRNEAIHRYNYRARQYY